MNGGVVLPAMAVALAVVLGGARSTRAQELDANNSARDRNPGVIADQIRNPKERAAFVAMYEKVDPQRMLARAEAFLAQYPDSAFLAQAEEIAARGNFDTGHYAQGLEDARRSLRLLPENPLLLVAVADVQASMTRNDDAIRSAADALQYLDAFARPISVAEEQWAAVKRGQQAIAHFAIGRAQLQKALDQSGSVRQQLLESSIDSLCQAAALHPQDQETRFLLGVAYLSAGQAVAATGEFAAVSSQGGELASRAMASLREIYEAEPARKMSFAEFIAQSGGAEARPSASATRSPAPAARLPEYAGSRACKDCHAEIYRNWSETGMAKMFRTYQPQNVIGDFEKNNAYYTGEDLQYLHGKLNLMPAASPASERRLFARMVVREGKHYFDIQQADGLWRSYPVDYTIGSKWQQAYATRLPNGEIHVFPIQYSVLEKRWLNYWRSLDGAGSERSDPYNFARLDDSTNYREKCAVCHTSQLRNTTGGGLDDDHLEFREPGVGCEMCHGPSADHVAGMTTGEGLGKTALDPPVDFKKIGSRDFVAICAQCHMQAALRESGPHGEVNYSTTGSFYPQTLSAPFGEFTRKGFYKDGRFSQTTFIVEALERSKCFRLGQASCGTCHDPHSHDFSTNRTSLRFRDEPDKMCTGCHTQFQDKAAASAHTRHSAASEGSRCVSCHMPRIMDALTFSARTHQIDDIPDAEMTLRFGRQESPNACLLCHQEKSAEWAKEELQHWKPVRTVSAPESAKLP